MSERSHNVNGIALRLKADDESLFAPLQSYLAAFAWPLQEDTDFEIALTRAPACDADPGAHVLFEGDLLPGVDCRLLAKGQQTWLIVPGQCSVAADRSARKALINLGSGPFGPSTGMAIIHALDVMLACSNQWLLHGAALTLPKDDNRAIVIFAPSGFGKTTTALALSLGGFGLLTDDAVVLQPGNIAGATERVWGLPRALKVHRRTSELLPSISPLLTGTWDSEGEQVLRTETLAASGLACIAPPRPANVVAVVVLGDRSSSDHHLLPTAKADVLVKLAADNAGTSTQGVPETDRRRFEAMAALVAVVPTYVLHVGHPLSTLASSIRGALRLDYKP